jgi:hypothetical protein
LFKQGELKNKMRLRVKGNLTKKDLTTLALFFDEYMQDNSEDDQDTDLRNTVYKIFKLTNWFNDE